MRSSRRHRDEGRLFASSSPGCLVLLHSGGRCSDRSAQQRRKTQRLVLSAVLAPRPTTSFISSDLTPRSHDGDFSRASDKASSLIGTPSTTRPASKCPHRRIHDPLEVSSARRWGKVAAQAGQARGRMRQWQRAHRVLSQAGRGWKRSERETDDQRVTRAPREEEEQRRESRLLARRGQRRRLKRHSEALGSRHPRARCWTVSRRPLLLSLRHIQ